MPPLELHPEVRETRKKLRPATDEAERILDDFWGVTAIAATPDGGVIAVGELGIVLRIGPDGMVAALAGRRDERVVDDGYEIRPFDQELGGLAIGPDGAIYYTDLAHHRVCRVRRADGAFDVVAGGGRGFRDGAGGRARFATPRGLVCAADGTLYVADAENARIRRISPDGRVTTLSWEPPHVVRGVRKDRLGALAIGDEGLLYVVDEVYGQVRRVSPDGEDLGLAGALTSDRSPDEPVLSAALWHALFLDQHPRPGPSLPGDLRLAIASFQAAGFDEDGGLVAIEIGQGRRLWWDGHRAIVSQPPSGSDSSAEGPNPGTGQLFVPRPWSWRLDPRGGPILTRYQGRRVVSPRRELPDDGPFGPLAFGPDGRPFLADPTGGRILVVMPGGGHEVAFQLPPAARINGRGARARFGVVTDVVAMPDGSVCVAEPHRCRVRRVAPDGTVTTLARWHPLDPLLGDGRRRFPGPAALAVDEGGRLFAMLPFRRRIVELAAGSPPRLVAEAPLMRPADPADAPDALANWPSFVALPGGRFLVADEELRALRLVDGTGDVATIALAPDVDPLDYERGARGPGRVARGPGDTWMVQMGYHLGLAGPGGYTGPLLSGFAAKNAPWTTDRAGALWRLDEDLIRYAVPIAPVPPSLVKGAPEHASLAPRILSGRWLSSVGEVVGKRLSSITQHRMGLRLGFEQEFLTIALGDFHGLYEIENEEYERFSAEAQLDPAAAIGATLIEADLTYGPGHLPVVKALRFDNGVRLRLGADVGAMVVVPAGWYVPASAPWELAGAAGESWTALAGRFVRRVVRVGDAVRLRLDGGIVATISRASESAAVPQRYATELWDRPPRLWEDLAGKVIEYLELRFATGAGGAPTRVVFRVDDQRDAAFEAQSGIRLTLG